MIRSALCMVKGHRVNRYNVWHDGLNFRTACEMCKAQMLRDGGSWRKFDQSMDGDTGRQIHPDRGNWA